MLDFRSQQIDGVVESTNDYYVCLEQCVQKTVLLSMSFIQNLSAGWARSAAQGGCSWHKILSNTRSGHLAHFQALCCECACNAFPSRQSVLVLFLMGITMD